MGKIIKFVEQKIIERRFAMLDKQILSMFLPEGILDYFEITGVTELPDYTGKELELHIELTEYNKVPSEYNSEDYESKGFFPTKKIHDFPIRDKAVYLLVKRRRWRHKVDKHEIHRDFSIFAKGVKMTQELSDFLKETGRDPRDFDERGLYKPTGKSS